MKHVFIFIGLLSVITLCSCRKTHYSIRGTEIFVNDIGVTHVLKGEETVLNRPHSGLFYVLDSLVFFYDPRHQPQHTCFNLKTGEEICSFFPRGRGPDEFLNVTPIMQVYEEKGDTKSFFVALNENKIGILNLSKSVKLKTTIIDTVFDYKWPRFTSHPPISFFKSDDSSNLLFFTPPSVLNSADNKYSLPRFVNVDYMNWDTKKAYDIYSEPGLYNKDAGNLNGEFYLSFNVINPSCSKIAMFMTLVSQVNILDINTGDLKSINISGTHEFNYLLKNPENYKMCYGFSDVDDKYIYGLYIDKTYTEPEGTHGDTINVFNWDGSLVYKLKLDYEVDQIRVDSQKRILYGNSSVEGKIFKYHLPF